jgi:hypothetical protein
MGLSGLDDYVCETLGCGFVAADAALILVVVADSLERRTGRMTDGFVVCSLTGWGALIFGIGSFLGEAGNWVGGLIVVRGCFALVVVVARDSHVSLRSPMAGAIVF